MGGCISNLTLPWCPHHPCILIPSWFSPHLPSNSEHASPTSFPSHTSDHYITAAVAWGRKCRVIFDFPFLTIHIQCILRSHWLYFPNIPKTFICHHCHHYYLGSSHHHLSPNPCNSFLCICFYICYSLVNRLFSLERPNWSGLNGNQVVPLLCSKLLLPLSLE